MDYKDYFRGKKITVMGLGLLGGIGDIRFLAEAGADLIVTDLKSAEEAEASLNALAEFPDIKFTLGKHDIADFRDRDLIIKAPSTPLDSIYIAEARKQGTKITMWAALFCKFAREKGVPIVGVTGSLGKTTTTEMIAHILTTAGKKIIVGGNVQGTSMLPQLEKLEPSTFIVLELDSWKLQGFGEEKISPNVAVFTVFVPDHMNYYKGDMDTYFADKANIFLNQTPEDTLICSEHVATFIQEKYKMKVQSHVEVAKAKDIPKGWSLQLPGIHNRENAACALRACRTLGLDEEEIKLGIESFTGVYGRLQLVREIHGIKIYNDTAATTPTAGAAGLRALDTEDKHNIIVIAGGADKTLDVTEFAQALTTYAKHVILLPGDGSNKLKDLLDSSIVTQVATLPDAVEQAMQKATEGDVVTLTPGFASFGLFANMYDRGDRFVELVKRL